MNIRTAPLDSYSANGSILVEVHHQTGVAAYGFATAADLSGWLKKACRHASMTTWTRSEWEASLDDRSEAHHADGIKLFDAGHATIVERSASEMDEIEVIAATEHDDDTFLFTEVARDLHDCYVLTRAETLAALGLEGTLSRRLSHHEHGRQLSAIKAEALSLGWVEPIPAPAEDEDSE